MTARANILNAARELFATNGYAATSPRDIMDRAKAGQGSFYHHFRSKSQLAAEVLTAVCSDLLGIGGEQLRDGRQPNERIENYLRADRDALRGCRLGRLAYDAGLEEDGLREPTALYFREMEALLTDAFREGGSADPPPENLAATALAVVQGGYVLSRIHRDPSLLRRAVEGLCALLTAGEAARLPQPPSTV